VGPSSASVRHRLPLQHPEQLGRQRSCEGPEEEGCGGPEARPASHTHPEHACEEVGWKIQEAQNDRMRTEGHAAQRLGNEARFRAGAKAEELTRYEV
jgi:hypothetical protein